MTVSPLQKNCGVLTLMGSTPPPHNSLHFLNSTGEENMMEKGSQAEDREIPHRLLSQAMQTQRMGDSCILLPDAKRLQQ